MLRSLCYVALRWLLRLAVLRVRSSDVKDLEIVVLRHELAIMRRRTGRPALTIIDRLFLTAASQFLPRASWCSFVITPATLLGWHRRWSRSGGPTRVGLVVRRSAERSKRWPSVWRDNPRWGYQRIVGELKGLGMAVSPTTVRTWLRAAGLGPAGTRGGMSWREFLRAHRRDMLAVDFFTVETIWLQRLYVLFFIELGSRRVHVTGCTPNPSAPWVTQQARSLTWTPCHRSPETA